MGNTIVLSCMSQGVDVNDESAFVLFSPADSIQFTNMTGQSLYSTLDSIVCLTRYSAVVSAMAQWPGLFVYKDQAHIVYGHAGYVWMDTVEGVS